MSSLAGVIGIIVLWGWLTNNSSLTHIILHSEAMQYNTAISFIAASLAIFALCKNYRLLTCVLGVFVLSVGYLSLAEYIIDLNFGLDSLFMPESLIEQESASKRMSPNGALILGLIGTSIFVLGNYMGFKLETRKLLFVLMIVNLIAITISFIAIFGYIGDLPGTSGWGSYTKMAIHTAVGNTLLSLGLIWIIYTTASGNNVSYASWAPWFIFAVLEVITLSFWQASTAYVEKNELQQNTLAAESIRSIVKDELQFRKGALSRMASRWQVRQRGNALQRMDSRCFKYNSWPTRLPIH